MRPVCPGVQRTAAMSSWEDVCFTTDMERARAEKRLYGLAVPVEAP